MIVLMNKIVFKYVQYKDEFTVLLTSKKIKNYYIIVETLYCTKHQTVQE